jgi:hypothetical protein
VLRRPGSRLRQVLTAWLAVELTAGILAVTVVVALGPLVAILLSGPRDPLLATVAVLSVSLPVAVVLGGSAVKLGGELLRQAKAG